jgi:Lamin Tail Domain
VFAGGPVHAATPQVQITKVVYNSPGTDNRSNSSLNAEYVRLTNRRPYSISLARWSLRDRSGHVYRFPSTFTLRAGKSVYVHTGRGTNSSTRRYWGQGNYVWNNTGDTAYLRKSSYDLVDSCRWGSSGSYTYC